MHLKFLCPNHRDWVYFHPQDALLKLEQSQYYGELLLQQGKWREALPFLGCAYETNEILFELYHGEVDFLVTHLTSLTVLLTACLEKLSCSEHAKLVFVQTYSTLNRVLSEQTDRNVNKEHIKLCLNNLKHNKAFIEQQSAVVFEDHSGYAH